MRRGSGSDGGDGWTKRTLALAGVALTVITSVITYTVTVTMLYAGIQQDIALIKQRQELRQTSEDLDHQFFKDRLNYLGNWAGDLQRQLDQRGAR